LKKGKVEARSWAYYEQQVRLYLKPVVGTVRLVDVDSLLVERFLAEMRVGGGTLEKPVTVYNQRAALMTLRVAMKTALRYRLIDSNPAREVERPKKPHREPKWRSAAEAAFLAHPAVAGHKLFALFRLALDTGMRQVELLALRWPDVDFAARTVHVRRQGRRAWPRAERWAKTCPAGVPALPAEVHPPFPVRGDATCFHS
jgi:integrase